MPAANAVAYKAVPEACPKCGLEDTWTTGPKYDAETDVLVWTCRQCEFRCTTPPRDATDPLQGWTPDTGHRS